MSVFINYSREACPPEIGDQEFIFFFIPDFFIANP